jgi:hypothetical protein
MQAEIHLKEADIMAVKLLFLLIGMLFFSFFVDNFPAVADIPVLGENAPAVLTDEYLRQVAVEKGILPPDWQNVDITKEAQERNTIVMWLLLSHEEKKAVVDGLKENFRASGVVIEHPSDHYVSEINGIIYRSIITGDISSTNKKGLGTIFKTVALMDGDFDDGQNKIKALQDYIGQEKFEEYKKLYPDKYRHLLEMDNQ